MPGKRDRRSTSLLATALCFVALGLLATAAPAHNGDKLSAYGPAVIDGVISGGEYDGSCIGPASQTAGSTAYQLTICETNDDHSDFYALQINDLTNDANDSPLLWFDNSHDGTITPGTNGDCATIGNPVEDYIGYQLNVFIDSLYCYAPPFTVYFIDGGQSIDGAAARNFSPGTGWVYEFSHPLDSGDPDDYSLAPHDTVGLCLTYDDKSNNDPNGFAVGELQYPPGCWVDKSTHVDAVNGSASKYADVYKENALDDALEKLKQRLKQYIAGCQFCPPDLKHSLLEKVNEGIQALQAQRKGAATHALQALIDRTRVFIRSGELGKKRGRRIIGLATSILRDVDAFKTFTPVPQAPPTSTQHGGRTLQVGPNGSIGRGTPPPR